MTARQGRSEDDEPIASAIQSKMAEFRSAEPMQQILALQAIKGFLERARSLPDNGGLGEDELQAIVSELQSMLSEYDGGGAPTYGGARGGSDAIGRGGEAFVGGAATSGPGHDVLERPDGQVAKLHDDIADIIGTMQEYD